MSDMLEQDNMRYDFSIIGRLEKPRQDMRAIYAVILAAALSGCYTAGSIRQSDVWLTLSFKGTPEEAIECMADRFEADGYMVTSRKRSLVVYQQIGLLFPQTYTYYTIDASDGKAELRARDDFIMPDTAKRQLVERLTPCATAS
jgi:hypothetical protein